MANSRKKRRLMFRRKRTLDPSIIIDYKNPEVLRRFVTDRGKIIPRRISGATAKQQRAICNAVKRARYLALLPYSLGHRQERNFATEMSAIATSAMGTSSRGPMGSRGPRSEDKGPSRDGEE
jgi:small subunit ribosomal protein S18